MRRVALALVAALCLVIGCGQPVDGTAVAGAPSLEEQFDPCTIPDDAIKASGLDPESRDAGLGPGTSTREWKICSWEGPAEDPWYSFHVQFSQNFTLSDVRRKPDNVDFSEVAVGGRTALRYRLRTTDALGICNLAFETEQGLTQVFANSDSSSDTNRGDLCQIVMLHTRDLEKYLPPT